MISVNTAATRHPSSPTTSKVMMATMQQLRARPYARDAQPACMSQSGHQRPTRATRSGVDSQKAARRSGQTQQATESPSSIARLQRKGRSSGRHRHRHHHSHCHRRHRRLAASARSPMVTTVATRTQSFPTLLTATIPRPCAGTCAMSARNATLPLFGHPGLAKGGATGSTGDGVDSLRIALAFGRTQLATTSPSSLARAAHRCCYLRHRLRHRLHRRHRLYRRHQQRLVTQCRKTPRWKRYAIRQSGPDFQRSATTRR